MESVHARTHTSAQQILRPYDPKIRGIVADARIRTASGEFSMRFHGEACGRGAHGGYSTGYELLNGSKGIAKRGRFAGEDIGDTQVHGTATVSCNRLGRKVIHYKSLRPHLEPVCNPD